MSEVIIPSSLSEIVKLSENEICSFAIDQIFDVSEMDNDEISERILELNMDDLHEELGQSHIDSIYSFITGFAHLSHDNQAEFIKSMIILVTNSIESMTANTPIKTKNTCKILLFYFSHMCSTIEEYFKSQMNLMMEVPVTKGKGKSKQQLSSSKEHADESRLDWVAWRSKILIILCRALQIEPSDLWSMSVVQENFLAPFWKYAVSLLELRPVGLAGMGGAEAATRGLCIDIILAANNQFNESSTSLGAKTLGCGSLNLAAALVDSICRYEHMTSVTADICARVKGSALVSHIMSEIAHMHLTAVSEKATTASVTTAANTANDADDEDSPAIATTTSIASNKGTSYKTNSATIKNVGLFLINLAESNPKVLCLYFPLVLPQLASDAHQIRSALIQCMGLIVMHVKKIMENQAITPIIAPIDVVVEGEEGVGEKEEVNLGQLERVRDSMLDMLTERVRDVNSFTRAHVLKVWTTLAEANVIPLERILAVADISLDRFMDKTAAVRKAAVQLFVTLLDYNPFAASLNLEYFKSCKVKLDEAFAAKKYSLMLQFEAINNNSNNNDQQPQEEVAGVDGDSNTHSPTLLLDIREEEFLASNILQDDLEANELLREIHHHAAAIAFIQKAHEAVGLTAVFLKSKTISDVTESLKFLARAINFSIPGSAKLFQSVFSLIWHSEETIRTEFIEAFTSVFLTDGAATSQAQQLPAIDIANNLQGLYLRCVREDRISLEKIIGESFSRQYISQNVVDICWSQLEHYTPIITPIVTPMIAPISEEVRNPASCALEVLTMVATVCPEILTLQRIELVIQQCLLPAVSCVDMSMMLATVRCIQLVSKSSAFDWTFEWSPIMMQAIPAIRSILIASFIHDTEKDTKLWCALCEEATNALFFIHPNPDHVLSGVLIELYGKITSDANSHNSLCSPFPLSRFLFLLGQSTLSTLVYAEKLAKEAKKASDSKAKIDAANSTNKEGTAVDAMEEEMGMAAAADADHDRIFNFLTEKMLLGEHCLFGKFLPMAAFVAANEYGMFSHSTVRETSVLALCRCMSVSSEVCATYLPLLFTLLEREAHESVRTTIVVALGDLAFRFPNAVEPWTSKMYSCLSDASLLVRYNMLMVLTHLILNEMVKVKGQVCHVVLCLLDADTRVSDLAKVFFHELSKRSNNPIYNLMGDIIAILSRDETGSAGSGNGETETLAVTPVVGIVEPSSVRLLSSSEFQLIMSFLLSFVKTDKLADGLVERILLRLGAAQTIQKRRNLAYCIAQLPITEKGIKKMTENIKLVKDALYDKDVLAFFRVAIKGAKKPSKSVAATAAIITTNEDASTLATGAAPLTVGDIQSASDELENILCALEAAMEGNLEEGVDIDALIDQTKSATLSSSGAGTTSNATSACDKKRANLKRPKSKKTPSNAIDSTTNTPSSKKKKVSAQVKKGKKVSADDEDDDSANDSDGSILIDEDEESENTHVQSINKSSKTTTSVNKTKNVTSSTGASSNTQQPLTSRKVAVVPLKATNRRNAGGGRQEVVSDDDAEAEFD